MVDPQNLDLVVVGSSPTSVAIQKPMYELKLTKQQIQAIAYSLRERSFKLLEQSIDQNSDAMKKASAELNALATFVSSKITLTTNNK